MWTYIDLLEQYNIYIPGPESSSMKLGPVGKDGSGTVTTLGLFFFFNGSLNKNNNIILLTCSSSSSSRRRRRCYYFQHDNVQFMLTSSNSYLLHHCRRFLGLRFSGRCGSFFVFFCRESFWRHHTALCTPHSHFQFGRQIDIHPPSRTCLQFNNIILKC